MTTTYIKFTCDNCAEVSDFCRREKESGFTQLTIRVQKDENSFPLDVRVDLCPNCFGMSNLKAVANKVCGNHGKSTYPH